MAMFLNTYEVDEIVERCAARAPLALPYAKFLADWRDIVDQNSDGWAHWRGGISAASQLLIQLNCIARHGFPTDESELRKALRPIKACATRNHLPCPELRS